MTDCPNTDLYKWIRRNQQYLSSKERADIIEVLLFDVDKCFGLSTNEWDQFDTNLKDLPTKCQHVIFDTGRKCLHPIFKENKCKTHY